MLLHLIFHIKEFLVFHYLNVKFCGQTKWIVRVFLISAHRTKLWHKLGLVVINVLICSEEEVVEFLKERKKIINLIITTKNYLHLQYH